MTDFNPNDIGNINNNIFGLPTTEDSAKVIFIPVPWDVTVSYNPGTSKGPQAIFDASFQVDLFDPIKEDAWETGYAMCPVPSDIKEKNDRLKYHARDVIAHLSEGSQTSESDEMANSLNLVNTGCSELVSWIKAKSKEYVDKNKCVVVIGGDHSVPLGFIQTLAGKFKSFGILQIDAHADLRDAYEGFEFSHASIMFNALKISQVSKLVQVGIRDYCQDEYDLIEKSKGRIKTFFDRDIMNARYEGKSWKQQCTKIISELPDNVYISFDIDGLDPKLCPNTGTPVPGGLELNEVLYLFEQILISGKKIIGFDLCEVSPGDDEWDANVGARILYRLANILAKSNNL
jgi:agmatinase